MTDDPQWWELRVMLHGSPTGHEGSFEENLAFARAIATAVSPLFKADAVDGASLTVSPRRPTPPGDGQ